MADTQPYPSIRERIKDLNTKAYYLLVALSFIYITNSKSRSLKVALTLTALVAVLPLQDYIKSTLLLRILQAFKVLALVVALGFALRSIWT